MSFQYQMQPMAPKPPHKPERRCFRMMRLPTDWDIFTVNQKMKDYFKNEIDFKIDSLYMRPKGKLQTALITFSPIIPQELQSGEDWKISVGSQKIVIGSCLDLTTLFEPEKKPVKAEYELNPFKQATYISVVNNKQHCFRSWLRGACNWVMVCFRRR